MIADSMAALTNTSNLWTARSDGAERVDGCNGVGAMGAGYLAGIAAPDGYARASLGIQPAAGDQQLRYTFTTWLTTTLIQKQQPLWQASYRNFAPRLGAAYQLSRMAELCCAPPRGCSTIPV